MIYAIRHLVNTLNAHLATIPPGFAQHFASSLAAISVVAVEAAFDSARKFGSPLAAADAVAAAVIKCMRTGEIATGRLRLQSVRDDTKPGENN